MEVKNKFVFNGEVLELYLTGGFVAYFDIEDFEKLKSVEWLPIHNGNKSCFYNCRNHIYVSTEKRLRAHNLVMDFKPCSKYSIDHINRNTLDNRKSNLRVATRATQCINQNIHTNSSTKITGVSYCKSNKCYTAHWYENGKKVRKNFSATF